MRVLFCNGGAKYIQLLLVLNNDTYTEVEEQRDIQNYQSHLIRGSDLVVEMIKR